MSGETDLRRLIAGMRPRLDAGRYVFATVAPDSPVPDAVLPLMSFREAEGMTLILKHEEAVQAGLRSAFPCRMITLEVHSALGAVGFLAAIAGGLAAAGIPVNPVAGFYHDHLFVPEERAAEAMQVLESMAAAAPAGDAEDADRQG